MKMIAWTNRFALALMVALASCVSANAQITINEATFESIALAQTDAGPQYNYEIDEIEELDSTGPYSFSEYGQAPGYSSSASVGCEHDSSLASDSMSLYGEAYSYVADDYGYAFCSADSSVGAYVTFTLSQESRVQISGDLEFQGYSANDSEIEFMLRPYGQAPLALELSEGTVSFDQVLPAGTYQLTLYTRVMLEIDFAGGDVYEYSRGIFDISMSAEAVDTVVPEFLNVRHQLTAEVAGEGFGDSDSVTDRNFNPFSDSFDISLSGLSAMCSLNSDMDEATGYFYAYGYAASSLYVQGSAFADSSSDFRTTFRLNNSGRIELSGTVGVSDFLGSDVSRDEPGYARVIVRVRDLDNKVNVVNKVITMNGYVPGGINQVDLEDEYSSVALPAGRYRLIVRAISNDVANNEQVEDSLAVAFMEVEGRIVEDGE